MDRGFAGDRVRKVEIAVDREGLDGAIFSSAFERGRALAAVPLKTAKRNNSNCG